MVNLGNFSNSYRYTLQKGSKKHICPSCEKKKFVRYVDLETKEYLPNKYGRCDRESNCSYHCNPYTDGYAKENLIQPEIVNKVTKVNGQKQKYFLRSPGPTSVPNALYFDFETFKATLQTERYDKNVFIQNLLTRVKYPFEINDITKAIELYRLGTVTTGYRSGATTFPFIDIQGKVRTIQVKQFDDDNHTKGTDFLHSIIEKHYKANNQALPEWLEKYIRQDKYVSCLFGEHILQKYPGNPIALVEAPKTAIYGALYCGFPDNPDNFIWLAVYNKSSFSFDKLKVLQGRSVYVFPDLSKDSLTYKEWEFKAKEYEIKLPGTRFKFSDWLERLAKDQNKNDGSDIADYLITKDWRDYRQHNRETITDCPDPVIIDQPIEKQGLNTNNIHDNIKPYLTELFNAVFTDNNNYSELDMIQAMVRSISIDQAEAALFFNYMKELDVISEAAPGRYYKHEGVPF